MSNFKVVNRLRAGENVRGATVMLTGATPGGVSLTQTTNAGGVAAINTAALANGTYTLSVNPGHSHAGAVGPSIAATPPVPDRIFRAVTGAVTIDHGNVTSAAVGGAIANGNVTLAAGVVQIELQPVWMQSPNSGSRGSTTITMIIVHHTGGPRIGPAINTFLSPSEETSAHYVIDVDGQVVKMVQESRRSNHAGEASWNGQHDINARSVGIEIVHATGAYPPAQYDALIELIAALRQAHPTIVDWNIVGHSDIAITGGRLGRKSSDPGGSFEWTRLEAQGWGLRPMIGPIAGNIYANYYGTFAGSTLRRGDNDRSRVLGGTRRAATFVGNPVRELQDDLVRLGYHLGTPDGGYGDRTRYAVQMFQEHIFTSSRGHKPPDGIVDQSTAMWVKRVVGAHP